ncbi:MAG: hypothetical protein Q7R73_03070 [bacterium]|nr:hypothetical protein [bacterium]
MKRFTTALLAIVFVGMLAGVSRAETTVATVDLPTEYEQRPHTYKNFCQIDDEEGDGFGIALFGKTDPETKLVESITNFKVVDINLTFHDRSIGGETIFLYMWLPKYGGIMKFDFQNKKDAETIGKALKIFNETMAQECPQIDKETTEFFDTLYQKGK